MNPALFYHPDSHSTVRDKVMGRNVAGESFLRGFLEQARNTVFWSHCFEQPHDREFEEIVRAAGRTEPVRSASGPMIGALREAGVVHFADPVLNRPAWQRSFFGDDAWSITGITHTTTSDRAMDAIVGLMLAPVQPWDALICTSRAARANIEALLDGQAEFMRDRFGMQRCPLPQLPVIPLGVHSADFAISPDERAAARAAHGVAADAIVVLFVGRMSFHAKAHPLPMYLALEQAARAAPGPVVLVECGHFGQQAVKDAFDEAAAHACPSVRRIHIDSGPAENRRAAWALGDVFCSLSDNLQETFGLTPLEAMAAGMPAVVSDWDGYKDTVRHGVDGFRVPTMMPEIDVPGDLALRHALLIDTFDVYVSRTALQVAVDIPETARAFEALFASAELRARMGAAAQARARSEFDWRAIIPRYEALWSDLDARRRADGPKQPRRRNPWPARPDPFRIYNAWPTATITPSTMFAATDPDPAAGMAHWRRLMELGVVNAAGRSVIRDEDVAALLPALAGGPATVMTAANGLPPQRRGYALRFLAILAKFGVVRAVLPEGKGPIE